MSGVAVGIEPSGPAGFFLIWLEMLSCLGFFNLFSFAAILLVWSQKLAAPLLFGV